MSTVQATILHLLTTGMIVLASDHALALSYRVCTQQEGCVAKQADFSALQCKPFCNRELRRSTFHT